MYLRENNLFKHKNRLEVQYGRTNESKSATRANESRGS